MTFDTSWRCRLRLLAVLLLALVVTGTQGLAQTDPLPSWNGGAAKKTFFPFD
jgi:hypothetical protein